MVSAKHLRSLALIMIAALGLSIPQMGLAADSEPEPVISTECGKPGIAYPVSGSAGNFTSPYGCSVSRGPGIPGASHCHKGVDFAAPIGSPVIAGCNGTIGYIDPGCYLTADQWRAKKSAGGNIQPSGGCTISIDCDGVLNGTLLGYGHLSAIKITKGQVVTKGQNIASSGNTGAADAAHMHFLMCKASKGMSPWGCPSPSNSDGNDPTGAFDCGDDRGQYGHGMTTARDMGLACVQKGTSREECNAWYQKALLCLSHKSATPKQCLAKKPPSGPGPNKPPVDDGSAWEPQPESVETVDPCVEDEYSVNQCG